MLGCLLLVIAMMARLKQPETQAAIGRALGETATPAAPEPAEMSRLLPAETFADVTDNAPFRSEEQAAWFAALGAVRDAEDSSLAAQSVGVLGYVALNSQPNAYRGRVVTIAGRVLRVEATEPAANDLGITKLWRVTMQASVGDVWPTTVYTLEEPKPAEDPYDAVAVGVFFKKLSYRWAEGIGSTPVLLAKRLDSSLPPHAVNAPSPAVQPQQPDAEFVRPTTGSLGRSLLQDLGFDVELFQNVTDKRQLTGDETQAFYALIGAVAQTPAPQLVRLARIGLEDYAARHLNAAGDTQRDRQLARAIETELAKSRYSVAPLFINGDAERGELIVLDANVRRAVRVDASDSRIAAEHGLDHYYELEAFTEDSQNLPIVFVMRDLPVGFPIGDTIRQPARLAGFFFKQWAYRGRTRTDAGEDQRQFAPLLIGRAPILLADPEPTRVSGPFVGSLCAIVLAASALAAWWLARQQRRTALARFRGAGDGLALDFNRLGNMTDRQVPASADAAPPAT